MKEKHQSKVSFAVTLHLFDIITRCHPHKCNHKIYFVTFDSEVNYNVAKVQNISPHSDI